MRSVFGVRKSRIPGCLHVTLDSSSDVRGAFVKTFHQDTFEAHGVPWNVAEEYYSWSREGVLRGLHFQLPPRGYEKWVLCVRGHITDVIVDLRVGSPTYGEHEMFDLDERRPALVYMPEGIAHGFLVHSDGALVLYKVSDVYSAEHDAGIRWDSAGIPWANRRAPILSDRDAGLPPLSEFKSPFRYEERGSDGGR